MSYIVRYKDSDEQCRKYAEEDREPASWREWKIFMYVCGARIEHGELQYDSASSRRKDGMKFKTKALPTLLAKSMRKEGGYETVEVVEDK